MRLGRPMLALLAASVLAISTMTATAATANAAPPTLAALARTDSADKPVLLVHGRGAGSCAARWGNARAGLTSYGWTGDIFTVGLYGGDTDCDRTSSAGDQSVPIQDLGKDLAWLIHEEFSQNDRPVDIIAHSMGGLVARAALTGVERQLPGWPPYLYVEDVATLGTPHAGTTLAMPPLCNTRQCVDMRPGSEFLGWVAQNPQSAQGTDWTLIGSQTDLIVSATSATDMRAGHTVIYTFPSILTHPQLRTVTGRDPWNIQYSNFYTEGEVNSSQGVSPIRTANNAIYWWWRW